MNTNVPCPAESARLDDLTAYVSTLLNAIHGQDLDAALMGEAKRCGRSDADFRTAALNNVHPDDLAAALIVRGYSLAKLGIVELGAAPTQAVLAAEGA